MRESSSPLPSSGSRSDGRMVKGQATRDRLVAAARTLFGEDGYDATSIEAVLASAGVARGALYHHFSSKRDLFDAVLEAVIAEVADAVADAARAAGDDPVASLHAGCGAWLRMALDPAVQRIALIDAPSVVGWVRWRQLDQQYTLGGLRHDLRRIARQGQLRRDDVDLTAHMVIAAVNEAALFIAGADDPEAAFAVGRSSVDGLLSGLVGHQA